MPSAAENVKEIGTLIDLGVKCLEGTTERSDGNRVRSARKEAVAMELPGRQYATGHVLYALPQA